MKVLALDLSSARGSAAVAQDGEILCQELFLCERGRGGTVFSVLEKMRDAWRKVDLIAVGVGPGSYNGLRTACALAGSIQLATGARLCSAPSPCLLDVEKERFTVFGDARGGRAYRAEVRNRALCGDIVLLEYGDIPSAARSGEAAAFRIGPLVCAEWLPEAQPHASVLAKLAPELPCLEPAGLRPLYLKPPHITMPRASRT